MPATIAFAQPAQGTMATPGSSEDIDVEIPDEFIREAQKFHVQCESTANMAQYYNCQCLANEFLNRRIELGPSAKANIIIFKISGTCADATLAAGYEYQICFENAPLVKPQGVDTQKYCECYANTYAQLYEQMKMSPNSRTFVRLQTQAHSICRDPVGARKLYRVNLRNKPPN